MMIIRSVASVFQAEGLTGVLRAIGRRIRTPRARCSPACREMVSGAIGLEIGGPRPPFPRAGVLPLSHIPQRVAKHDLPGSPAWGGGVTEREAVTLTVRTP